MMTSAAAPANAAVNVTARITIPILSLISDASPRNLSASVIWEISHSHDGNLDHGYSVTSVTMPGDFDGATAHQLRRDRQRDRFGAASRVVVG
jgi:hypothetical protein